MSQFTKRFQPPPPQTQEKGTDARLRVSPGAYPQDHTGSVYTQRHPETEKIKGLSFWKNTGSDDEEDGQEEGEWTERQSATPFILAVIILVVASTLLWFLFQWASSENTNTPLVIPADTAPFKVRPENPGGMRIPHQDKLIYGRLSQNAQPQPMERLLPPPEQPMAAPPHQQQLGYAPLPQHQQPPQQQPYYPQGYSQGYPPEGQGYAGPSPQGGHPDPAQQGIQQHPPFQQGASQQQPYPPQAQAPYPQQRPLPPHHPTYAQPQSPYGPPVALPSQAHPMASPIVPVPAPSAPKPSTVGAIKPALDEEEGGDDSITREGYNELNQLIAKEAEAPLKRPVKKDTAPLKLTPLDPGKHKVQIASLSSRPMAEQEIKRLRLHHGPVFGSKSWNIQKVNLGSSRGFTYRLVVGSFSNHAAAAKFCKKLRSEKIGCKVVAPVE